MRLLGTALSRILLYGGIGLFLPVYLGARQQSVSTASGDKTLSPYFFVRSNDPADKFPLKSTSAKVAISGAIADVEVTQVYRNEGKNSLEAYRFLCGR
jgi:Ca-activated chloride channel family protein